jgi:hypothetical protein
MAGFKSKSLSILISLAMLLSLFSGLGGAARAAPDGAPATSAAATTAAPGAPQPWPSNNTITVGGEYTIPVSLTNSTVTIRTPDPVTLIGKGFSPGSDFAGISVAYTVPGANLALREVYISSPNGAASIIDFNGVGNTLRPVGNNILESNGYNNNAVVHVGPGAELTIAGDDNSNLYLYKSSVSAAIGGNEKEACGAITFASGNVFAKGTQTGATIGGDDATGGAGHINGDITISGGQLCVETNARGAAIGASSQGECAGNVFITGGKTLINVDFSGSAIGRGAMGSTVGSLYVTGGSLEVYVDANAASYWGGSGPNDTAVTAAKFFGSPGATVPARMAAVDITGVDFLGKRLVAAITPDGSSTPQIVYLEDGINQYGFTASLDYTPDNWTYDQNDRILYLFLPTSPVRGIITVAAQGSPQTANYSYAYSSAGGFTVSPSGWHTVNFDAPNAQVYANGGKTPAASVLVPNAGAATLYIVPDSGYEIANVTTSSGTVTNLGGGYYKLAGVITTGPATVTVQTDAAAGEYAVSFSDSASGTAAPVSIGGIQTSKASVAAGQNLTFSVWPHLGYVVTASVTPASELEYNGGGIYTLTNVTADTTVVISNTPGDAYSVTFIGGNAVVSIGGVTTDAAIIAEGESLPFAVTIPDGYVIQNVIASSGTVTGGVSADNGDGSSTSNYVLSGVEENANVYITVTQATYYTVTFATTDAAVYINGQPATSAVISAGGTLTFDPVPNAGYTLNEPTTTNGALTKNPDGTYTLTGVTADATVTVTASGAATYAVTFDTAHATVYINGEAVTTATIPAGGSLEFSVTPDAGYGVEAVKASNGNVIDLGGGDYILERVTSATTVTVLAVQGYAVTFTGGNMQVRVNGTATTSATIAPGGTLSFTVVPDLGYAISGTPSTSSGSVSGSGGSYVLSGVSSDATVTAATAADAAFWTSVPATVIAGSGTVSSPYLITSADDLATLMIQVNAGATYDEEYFKLTADIDLSARNWAPIGGGRDLNAGGEATGNYFAGNFDGGGHVISGMKLPVGAANSGAGAYGLFGFVKNGTIQNLTLGSANSAAVTAGDNNAVAAVVGYTTGSVYNVTNNVPVTVSGSGVSSTAGIAAVADNKGNAASFVQYCVNNAPITGRSRLGGIVGAAYAVYNGGVVIDQSYNAGDIHANDSNGRAYVGGVVGYCKGYITNCYNTGNISVGDSTTADMHIYTGGVAGLLNGEEAPYAAMSDSFNMGIITVSNPSVALQYVEPLWGYSDKTTDIVVSDCAYLDVSVVDPATGQNKPQDQLGVTVTDVLMQTAAQMSGATLPAPLDSQYFAPGSPNPTLLWTAGTGAVGPIYVDTDSSGANPDGTIGNPYNNIVDAAAAQSAFRGTIYVEGSNRMPGVSRSITLNPQGGAERVVRWNGFQTELVYISGAGIVVTVNGGAIDGNLISATDELIYVMGSALVLNNVTLRNNIDDFDGAILVSIGGTATMNGGAITGNTAVRGGGVYIDGGTFTQNGGDITGNAATENGGGVYAVGGAYTMHGGSIAGNTTGGSGGGVYVSDAAFTITGGTIAGNAAAGNGGGVYISATGTFNLNGGTISGNTAALGHGIYVAGTAATNQIIFNPAPGTVVTVSDVIYLNGTGTTGARIGLSIALSSSNVSTPLIIQLANPSINRIIAQAPSNADATASLPYIKTWQDDPTAVGGTSAYIIYNNPTLKT